MKSGAVIFLISSSTITSLAICRRLAAILQTLEAVLHLGDTALEPLCQGFIGKRGPDNGRDDLVHVGYSLHRVGEGLLIDAGIFRPDPVADDAVGNGSEFKKIDNATPNVNFDERGRPTRCGFGNRTARWYNLCRVVQFGIAGFRNPSCYR